MRSGTLCSATVGLCNGIFSNGLSETRRKMKLEYRYGGNDRRQKRATLQGNQLHKSKIGPGVILLAYYSTYLRYDL